MKQNLFYVTPAVEYIECEAEGVLCQSGELERWQQEKLLPW